MGENPEKISRCRLCIFQLIHVPIHIKWHGSIRNCSQACCERSLGEVERKIQSRKAPFENLANIITEKELLRILHLYFPSIATPQHTEPQRTENFSGHSNRSSPNPLRQNLPIQKADKDTCDAHLEAISEALAISEDELDSITTQRWGKAKISTGRVLQSQLSDLRKPGSRAYRWFEVCIPLNKLLRFLIYTSLSLSLSDRPANSLLPN